MLDRYEKGFSLAELAVVLVIVAILSAGAISTLRAQNERSQFSQARALLDETREALLNFAAVTGSLPCPDTSADGSIGDPGTCAATGVQQGFVPWRTLGIARQDPWGQPLRYAVHTTFTNPASLTLTATSALNIRRQLSDGTMQDLANSASVVMALWSTGPDAQSTTTGTPNSRVIAESPGSDDIVTWLSRFILVGRMLEAGRDIPQ